MAARVDRDARRHVGAPPAVASLGGTSVGLIALTAMVILSIALGIATTRATLSLVFFFMNRGTLRTEALADTGWTSVAYR
jgi:hypothetical protein